MFGPIQMNAHCVTQGDFHRMPLANEERIIKSIGSSSGLESAFLFPSKILRFHSELEELKEECGIPNWDGEGAEAIGLEVLGAADRFVRCLGLRCAIPELAPGKEGQLYLDWYEKREHTLTMMIYGSGRVYYSLIKGLERKKGTFFFEGEIEEDLIKIIQGFTDKEA